ncbi:MAG: hypothetical protein OEO23_00010 [Gemmatimonadota bacterium]|nr:hypothetical protein [Gemmatimonadota bacterium]
MRVSVIVMLMVQYSEPRPGGAGKRRRKKRRGGSGKRDAYAARQRLWRELAEERGGILVLAKNPMRDTLTIPLGPHDMKVGIYGTSDGSQTQFFTRITVLFAAAEDFGFKLTRHNAFTRLLDRVGIRSATMGNPRIDHEYRVRSPRAWHHRLRSYFLDGRLRADLVAAGPERVEVGRLKWWERGRWTPDARELRVLGRGLFLERSELIPLMQLCESALVRLEGTGAASPRPPGARRPSVSSGRSRP